ncbi:hypothetical protein BGX27_007171 [Mortierella sp. AM989]|nr:hypothetical protein BGX27_007171 [Mortierella sp. AM989]
MSKRLRELDVPLHSIVPSVVDSLLRLHSNTLATADWTETELNEPFDYIQRIFSSCPNLTKACFKPILVQEFLEGFNFWVCCDSLEELRMDIIMNPSEFIPLWPKMTERGKQDMLWVTFAHLARLRSLKVLDLGGTQSECVK